MARQARIEYPGALYHVISRGIERRELFRDDEDRERYLGLLEKAVGRYRCRIFAYCLMGNHVHLAVEAGAIPLSRVMRSMNTAYAGYFNKRHRRAGYLFQGRYKAIHVEKEAHLLEFCRYVVLNPVRARLVQEAKAWPWSSYRATIGKMPPPKWLEVDWTLSQFGRKRSLARKIFERFVAEGRRSPSPLKKVRHQVYLGGESFLIEMDSRLKGATPGEDIPQRQRAPSSPSIEMIRKAVARELGVAESGLSRSRGGEDKIAGIYLASVLTGKTGAEVGRAFGVKPARVSNVVSEVERGRRPALVKRLLRIRKALESGANV
jgi:putative transposase